MATSRLKKELEQITKDPPSSCSAGLAKPGDYYHWTGSIIGPRDTPYEGGIFYLDIKIPENYPYIAPKVKFITRVYHPNVSSNGTICISMLKDDWTPAYNIARILLAISSLLADPNPDDPLVPEIAQQYKENRDIYNETARMMTQKFAN